MLKQIKSETRVPIFFLSSNHRKLLAIRGSKVAWMTKDAQIRLTTREYNLTTGKNIHETQYNSSQIVCAPFKTSDSKTMCAMKEDRTSRQEREREREREIHGAAKWRKSHFNRKFSRGEYTVVGNMRQIGIDFI